MQRLTFGMSFVRVGVPRYVRYAYVKYLAQSRADKCSSEFFQIKRIPTVPFLRRKLGEDARTRASYYILRAYLFIFPLIRNIHTYVYTRTTCTRTLSITRSAVYLFIRPFDLVGSQSEASLLRDIRVISRLVSRIS